MSAATWCCGLLHRLPDPTPGAHPRGIPRHSRLGDLRANHRPAGGSERPGGGRAAALALPLRPPQPWPVCGSSSISSIARVVGATRAPHPARPRRCGNGPPRPPAKLSLAHRCRLAPSTLCNTVGSAMFFRLIPLLGIAILAGCGPSSKVSYTTGRVTYKGKNVPFCRVIFHSPRGEKIPGGLRRRRPLQHHHPARRIQGFHRAAQHGRGLLAERQAPARPALLRTLYQSGPLRPDRHGKEGERIPSTFLCWNNGLPVATASFKNYFRICRDTRRNPDRPLEPFVPWTLEPVPPMEI